MIVDITFDPINESDYFAFAWSVRFPYSDLTKHCIKNMVQEFAKMLEDENFTNDLRWNLFFTFIGQKTLQSKQLGDLAFNQVILDFNWIARSSSNRTQEFSEAQAIYARLLSAYTFQGSENRCTTLDPYLEILEKFDNRTKGLKEKYASTYASAADSRSMSDLHSNVTLVDWAALGLEKNGIPFTSSFQQGPKYPHADDLLNIVDHIDALMPAAPGTDQRFVIAQLVVLPGPRNAKRNVAQPFQDDVFGVVVDVWSLDQADYRQDQRELQDFVISAVGGVDHRMFWGAYEDTCLECGALEKYYESCTKYNRLQRIKGCVDPDNLFKFRMSIPGLPRSGDSGSKKSGMRSKSAKEKSPKTGKGKKSGKTIEPL